MWLSIDTKKRFGLSYKTKEFTLLIVYVTIISAICFQRNLIGNVVNCIIAFPMFFLLNKDIVKPIYLKLASSRKNK